MNSILIALVLSQAAVSPATQCSGFYSYIPRNIEKEVAFSVEVQPTAIEVLYTDYGNIFVRKVVRPDGSIRFNDGQGGSFLHLKCSGQTATLSVEADRYSPARTFALVRTKSDIWAVARARRWNVGD